MNIVSDEAFRWALTAITGIVAGGWGIYDTIRLIRSPRPDSAVTRDRRFGYIVGISVGLIGVIGCFRFHGVM